MQPTVAWIEIPPVPRDLSTSMKNILPSSNAQSDQINCTYNHHRNKKKKYMCLNSNTHRCIFLGVILLIITIIALSIALPILLIKKLPTNCKLWFGLSLYLLSFYTFSYISSTSMEFIRYNYC